MDAVDLRLIELVQRDATVTNKRLGEIVGASASAVHRRIRKLQADGVIKVITAIVDPVALGRSLTLVVGLEIERKQPELYDRLQRWLVAEDAIQQAYNVTGQYDFIIILTSQTMEQYDSLMNEMLAKNPNIKKYTTNVALHSFKQSLFVPST
ncbi:MAG: Lrp/AsnC family transcriptional regulator [Alphaproteobacteria bacterium]